MIDDLLKYSNNKILKSLSSNLEQALQDDFILINLDEMESLIKPEHFDFPDIDVGNIQVENV